jgi:DNA repair protein RadA/Sms
VQGGGTAARTTATAVTPLTLNDPSSPESRVRTGIPGIDRVLGGGVVPGSVVLLGGEPGIGKSTLVLQVLAALARGGRPGLLASGEESRAQVAARAARLGATHDLVSFVPGRDLAGVLAAARHASPFVLAVDSVQTLRDTDAAQVPGGVAQVRACTDALVGLAKDEGITVLVTGHVTKDGDLAGPRALEHAVDVVLTFDGETRSGLRMLSGGKNRFGVEGETAWFEMRSEGLAEIDPTASLHAEEGLAGSAVALPQAGRRAFAVDVQALVGGAEGPARRQAAGLDPRRFQLVAAVLDRATGLGLGRAELFGATAGGVRVDDPACDLAVAAAIASAASGSPAPSGAAFVGEVSLTGLVRPVPSLAQRAQAARAAGCTVLYAPQDLPTAPEGVRILPVRHVRDAVAWALSPAALPRERRPA